MAFRKNQIAADGPLEMRVQEIGRDYLIAARGKQKSLFSGKFWSDKLIDWAMKDEAFKVQLFRFVDAFPMLKTPQQVHDVLTDYLSQPGVTPPPGMAIGLKAGGLLKGTLAKTISSRITAMAERFIAGTDSTTALPKLRQRWDSGIGFSVDLLGEACVSAAEATAYRERYLSLVRELPGEVANWPDNPTVDTDHLGPIPRTNVSVKISSLSPGTDPINFDHTLERMFASITPILEEANRLNVLVNFDVEQWSMKELTYQLFMRCCERVEFTAGLAMQAYLRSGDEDAQMMIDWAKRTGKQFTVRLVKGAYWDYETIHAEQMGWPVPVWSHKPDTDACFERMTEMFAAAIPTTADEGGVKLALGSHNLRSIAYAMACLEQRDLPMSAMEIQMLQGMGDEFKAVFIERGLRVREYIPVGDMIPGMAYLVRRLLENTSNQSWLRIGSSEDVPADVLLARPQRVDDVATRPRDHVADARQHLLSPPVAGLGNDAPFINEPPRDFTKPDVREAFTAAVKEADVPGVVNTVDADRAVAQATESLAAWRDVDPMVRAHLLVKAAARMRRYRDELAGLIVQEAGKIWREADMEVCEAIDFCEFHARCAIDLLQPRRLGRYVGELNEQAYEPRGVMVVDSPWNFPLAAGIGMTSAALVTGNTVLVRLAAQTPHITTRMFNIFHHAGVRDGALQLVDAAAVIATDEPHVIEVARPAGGRNTIIVDASADLDEAVLGVRDSAFSYAGQKGSACSRVIVVESAHDVFLRRLVEATRALTVGDPRQPGTSIGPVISAEAAAQIAEYIEIGKTEGKLEIGGPVPDEAQVGVNKPLIMPHIFSAITSGHRLANETIGGPVLAVLKVESFDEALQVANASDCNLAGSVYTRKPAHLQRARREFRVGTLFLNRGCTGARVGRQPLGELGGRDYLRQFVQPRSCCENTMRHGFAPGLAN